jgi:prophage antirepressor-like protein
VKELVRLFDEKPIRTVVVRGEPWWVAKDVAVALGYANPQKAVRDHCTNAKPVGVWGERFVHPIDPQTIVIAEPDLYRLIIRSNLPAAERFERWIFEEVLPAIRKTGSYSISAEARRESIAARSALTAEWATHGADKFYHFINLTKAEYEALFGDKAKKKADMTREELAALKVFESIEYLKLVKNEEIHGYRALVDSVAETGRQLPMFTDLIAATRQVSA